MDQGVAVLCRQEFWCLDFGRFRGVDAALGLTSQAQGWISRGLEWHGAG